MSSVGEEQPKPAVETPKKPVVIDVKSILIEQAKMEIQALIERDTANMNRLKQIKQSINNQMTPDNLAAIASIEGQAGFVRGQLYAWGVILNVLDSQQFGAWFADVKAKLLSTPEKKPISQ